MLDLPDPTTGGIDLSPHFDLLSRVLREGWKRAIAHGATWASMTTRKNEAFDAMGLLLATEAKKAGLNIGRLPKGREVPLLIIPGARYDYSVRFNCLDASFRAAGINTKQRQMFEAQPEVLQMRLPGFKPTANIRAGYILDSAGMAIVRTVAVLSHKDTPIWHLDIPDHGLGGGTGTVSPVTPITSPSSGSRFTSTKPKAAPQAPAVNDDRDQ